MSNREWFLIGLALLALMAYNRRPRVTVIPGDEPPIVPLSVQVLSMEGVPS